jgi:hypothetical protein
MNCRACLPVNSMMTSVPIQSEATPKGKGGLQRVNVTTEVPNSDIAAPDNVWVAPGN